MSHAFSLQDVSIMKDRIPENIISRQVIHPAEVKTKNVKTKKYIN